MQTFIFSYFPNSDFDQNLEINLKVISNCSNNNPRAVDMSFDEVNILYHETETKSNEKCKS